jgi:hypothetical protein
MRNQLLLLVIIVALRSVCGGRQVYHVRFVIVWHGAQMFSVVGLNSSFVSSQSQRSKDKPNFRHQWKKRSFHCRLSLPIYYLMILIKSNKNMYMRANTLTS